MTDASLTRTGGREATTGYIAGDCALAVGMPDAEPRSGWRWQLLTDLARLETGHTPSRRHPEYWGGDIPWIGIRDATGNHGRTIQDTEQHVTQEGIDNSSARVLPTNTVCLSRTASVGYVVVMGRPMATSQDFVNWVCDSEVLDYRFLKYALLAERTSYSRFSHGTTHQTIYFPEVKAFHLCVPSRADQTAIADVLSALDDKIEQNRRTARALERLVRTIFRAWFVDFEPVKAKAAGASAFPSMPQTVFDALPIRFVESDIGPVPEGWGVGALSSVCTLVGGGTPRRSEPAYWGGDVPWYSVRDAPGDGEVFVIKTSERITEDGVANSAAKVVPRGTTIISARGTVGKLAMAGLPMAFNQSCYGLIPGDGRSFCYLHLLLQTAAAELQQRTHGSVFDTITHTTFDGLLVVKPRSGSLPAFEVLASPLFELLLASLRESSRLSTMRDYLLPRLMSADARVKGVDG